MFDDNILNKLNQLPSSAGVYQYFDKNTKLLYVGKATNLKNRVRSYFSFTPTLGVAKNLSARIEKMINEVSDISYLLVNNEHDALILENSLIKQLKPKYNILLRDDKTYPYIYVDLEQDFPRFDITRKIIDRKNIKYFGPFSVSAKYILKAIYDSFKLVQRKSCVREKKACLFYQINKCLAPCEGKVSKDQYSVEVKKAISFLMDRKLMSKTIVKKMNDFADNLQFEDALEMKKTLNAINKGIIKTPLDFMSLEDIDIFTIFAIKNKACILKTFIKKGKVVSTDYKIIKDQLDIDVGDIYQRVIVDFYNANNILVPKSILLAHTQNEESIALLQDFLFKLFGKNISIYSPKIGTKKHLIDITILNAKMLLNKSIDNNDEVLLVAMRDKFELSSIPYRIEIFDNSHISNQARIGAMVVYEDALFAKDSYRQYKLTGNNDYAFMTQTLTRRLDNREKEPLPNLWILDGGKALLDLAISLIDSLGIDLDVIAISKEKVDAKANRSKGKARDIVYTKNNIYRLGIGEKELLLTQKLRDEAHRFAIKNHRLLKAKEDKQISLLNVKGIGEHKIKKLISYFGSFEAIKQASFSDISNVVSSKDATSIFEYFSKD